MTCVRWHYHSHHFVSWIISSSWSISTRALQTKCVKGRNAWVYTSAWSMMQNLISLDSWKFQNAWKVPTLEKKAARKINDIGVGKRWFLILVYSAHRARILLTITPDTVFSSSLRDTSALQRRQNTNQNPTPVGFGNLSQYQSNERMNHE